MTMGFAIIVATAEEAEKIMETANESLHDTRQRLDQARSANKIASQMYHEALLQLGEDDDDDFATALEKSQKYERIEAEFITAGHAYEKALTRFDWELKAAEKAGLVA